MYLCNHIQITALLYLPYSKISGSYPVSLECSGSSYYENQTQEFYILNGWPYAYQALHGEISKQDKLCNKASSDIL